MENLLTPYQNAIRILFILVHGAKRLPENDPSGVAGLFVGETRLHAMDFWVRYPDYLAYELINIYEETKNECFLELAEEILDTQEPDLRRIPMVRYLFGAYERVDNALSVLIAKGLLYQDVKQIKAGIRKHRYFIRSLAYDKRQEILNNPSFQSLNWYEDRAKLVAQIVGERKGNELKARQYEHIQYAKTKLGGIIPAINEEVKLRLQCLKSMV
jgi:hypothetical protein